MKTIKLWLLWLEAHPWAIVAALASVLLAVLGWGRKSAPVADVLRATEASGVAKASKSEADATEKRAVAAERQVAKDAAALEHVEAHETTVEHLRGDDDEDVANVFSGSGL